MKIPLRLLPALILPFLAGSCLAATQVLGTNEVAISISGTLQTGASILVNAGSAIESAPIYSYAITGTCHGTGAFEGFIPAGTPLAQALALVDTTGSNLIPYLQAAVLDPNSSLPIVFVNRISSQVSNGYVTLGPVTVAGQARLKAGIGPTGLGYVNFTNVSFGMLNGSATQPDYSDGIVIDNGQMLIEANPSISSTTSQPDLAFNTPTGLVGLGIINTTGSGQSESVDLARNKSASFTVALVNSGTGADSFKLTAPSLANGFVQTFIYQKKNVTSSVTNGGLLIPPSGTLLSGSVATLTWTLKNTSGSGVSTSFLTATSVSSTTRQDTLSLTGSGQ